MGYSPERKTAVLNEADLAEYCRKRGVFAAQIKAWRVACEQANDWARIGIGASTAKMSQATKEVKQRIKAWRANWPARIAP